MLFQRCVNKYAAAGLRDGRRTGDGFQCRVHKHAAAGSFDRRAVHMHYSSMAAYAGMVNRLIMVDRLTRFDAYLPSRS